jgi:E3 ubiquitin-protein ligase MARCH6
MAPPPDPDTCRICRGEGLTDEPLFYPCKCSGSIKYVHQDCLMEWLSHSQKKHCELCKTPFRFTKLYSSSMPKSLPAYVFCAHMAKYLLRNLMVWLRAALVVSVWLCWLPYLMRSVWAFLFWISDEGLGGGSFFSRSNGTFGVRMNGTLLDQLTTCPSSPLFVATTTVSTIGGILEQIPFEQRQSSLFTNTIYGVNVTTSDHISATLLRVLFGSMGYSRPNKTTSAAIKMLPAVGNRQPSLLSDVTFLRNLTRFPAFNRTIITALEGQVITVLVIVCFILIILVRDYVVQQQPEINMRAAFAAQENAQQNQRENEAPADEDLQPLDGADESDEETVDIVDNLDPTIATEQPELPERHEEVEIDFMPQHRLRPRPIAGFQRRLPPRETPNADNQTNEESQLLQPDDSQIAEGFTPPVGRAGEDKEGSAISEYLRIYRQAEGDPQMILKIVEEEHLEDRLGYWVRKTQSLLEKDQQRPSAASQVADSNPQPASPLVPTPSDEIDEPASALLQLGRHALPPLEDEDWAVSGWPKGKAKEFLTDDSNTGCKPTPAEPRVGLTSDDVSDISKFPPHSSRPRAISDGPRRQESVNPLANNSWSFSTISQGSEALSMHDSSKDSAEAETTTSMSTEIVGDGAYPPSPPSSTRAVRGSPVTRPQQHPEASRSTTPNTVSSPNGLSSGAEVSWSPEGASPTSLEDTMVQNDDDASSLDAQDAIQEGPVVPQADTRDARGNDAPPAQGFVAQVANFLWGDIPQEMENVIVDELADLVDDIGRDRQEALDAEVEHDELDIFDIDGEAVDAAVAGLDPEAIEDAEDFEGIMELIGMRGPIAGLFQNAIFCAVLVSVTIFLCIFIPYNIGRMTVWAVANPMRLVRMAFGLTKFVQDLVVAFCGLLTFSAVGTVWLLGKIIGWPPPNLALQSALVSSWGVSKNATNRVLDTFVTEFPIISTSEMQNFSAISHDALLTLKGHISWAVSAFNGLFTFLLTGDLMAKTSDTVSNITNSTMLVWHGMGNFSSTVFDPDSWVISFSLPETSTAINPELASWTGMDRFWATMCGYVAVSFVAAWYLRRGTPISSGQTGQEWEASLIDILNQASGVMKVILIISIEMLIFPLYCGLLLDAALLPLFESTTLKSRLLFTINYPLTSIFVHWFVGTGYMFHFALFVSMCRKIMRKGVLCK